MLQGSYDSTLCGGLTYGALLEGVPLTDSSMPPVAYDGLDREFSVFSNDYDFDGLKTLTVNAYMTDYSMHTHSMEIELQIYNPCSETEFVQILGATPDKQTYILYTSSLETP